MSNRLKALQSSETKPRATRVKRRRNPFLDDNSRRITEVTETPKPKTVFFYNHNPFKPQGSSESVDLLNIFTESGFIKPLEREDLRKYTGFSIMDAVRSFLCGKDKLWCEFPISQMIPGSMPTLVFEKLLVLSNNVKSLKVHVEPRCVEYLGQRQVSFLKIELSIKGDSLTKYVAGWQNNSNTLLF